MVAIGCLALFVLALLGLVLGGWLPGPSGARWGLGTLVVAVVLCGASAYALTKVAARR